MADIAGGFYTYGYSTPCLRMAIPPHLQYQAYRYERTLSLHTSRVGTPFGVPEMTTFGTPFGTPFWPFPGPLLDPPWNTSWEGTGPLKGA